ncbi:MAG: DUF4271 domain-containing protein [Flavobacteriales bacterium]
MDEWRVVRDQDWMTVLFVMILLLCVVFKGLFYKNYVALCSLKAYLSVKDNFVLFTTSFLLIITLSYTFLVYIFCLKNHWPVRYGLTSYKAFFFFFICLFLFSLFRFLINQLVFYLFNKKEYFSVFYQVKTFYEWRFLKIIVFLEIFITYTDFYDYRVFYLVVVVFAVFVFIRCLALFRGVVRVMAIPIYHIMMYICSLEVLPILVLFKYMIGIKQ